ncbi:MAG: N-acetyl sugar amidotransferase [Candidatus Woesearchaeota archaeon]
MSFQECKNCVMNTEVTDLTFDEKGICNFCNFYFNEVIPILKRCQQNGELEKVVKKIKAERTGEYDCLIGLSGGVDSSFVALQVKKLGLRPLSFHVDNGWNSDISVRNIKNIVNKTGFDFFTYVIDWEEFKDMQLSFIRAGVIDIELLTDHAITAVAFKLIKKEKIKYFISGSNYATEAIMPPNWSYYKWDNINIKAIHKRFGKLPIKTFPTYNFFDKIKSRTLFKVIRLLDYINYNKIEAMKELEKEFGWEYYGGKHYESNFTKFYQAYILPTKFKVDKRYAHLSNLICSGAITKEEAKKELEKPLYEKDELEKEIDYFLKKFNLSKEEFNRIMNTPPKSHLDYPNGVWINNILKLFTRG